MRDINIIIKYTLGKESLLTKKEKNIELYELLSRAVFNIESHTEIKTKPVTHQSISNHSKTKPITYQLDYSAKNCGKINTKTKAISCQLDYSANLKP